MRSNCEACGTRVESNVLYPYIRNGARFWLCFDCVEVQPLEDETPERSTFDG